MDDPTSHMQEEDLQEMVMHDHNIESQEHITKLEGLLKEGYLTKRQEMDIREEITKLQGSHDLPYKMMKLYEEVLLNMKQTDDLNIELQEKIKKLQEECQKSHKTCTKKVKVNSCSEKICCLLASSVIISLIILYEKSCIFLVFFIVNMENETRAKFVQKFIYKNDFIADIQSTPTVYYILFLQTLANIVNERLLDRDDIEHSEILENLEFTGTPGLEFRQLQQLKSGILTKATNAGKWALLNFKAQNFYLVIFSDPNFQNSKQPFGTSQIY